MEARNIIGHLVSAIRNLQSAIEYREKEGSLEQR